jgi:beta-galactosidase
VQFGDAAAGPDEAIAWFGFRHVDHKGSTLRINGRTVFLRGTLDCCVYPETGHPPMTQGAWERVLGVVKQYGFNHVRFHTWCPPDAAFEAADRLGLYLQPETPAWIDDWGVETVTRPRGIGRDPEVVAFLRAELRRVCAAYGNHPSFVMLAIGNEFGFKNTDWACVNEMVQEIKLADPRRLYSGCTARKHLPADDYWVTHDSGAATRGLGPAHTDWDLAKAAAASPVPVIAHETGQRPVFPDYERLLPAFTGPLAPLNPERYRRVLQASRMERQAREFVRTSALFQLAHHGGTRSRDSRRWPHGRYRPRQR